MFRKSRLVIFALTFFFLGAGVVGAYLRCLELWPISEEQSETVKAGSVDSHSGGGVLDCPEDWSRYRYIQAKNSLKNGHIKGHKSPAVIHVVSGYSSLTNYASRTAPPLLSSAFPYPSVAIYQLKVVYRI